MSGRRRSTIGRRSRKIGEARRQGTRNGGTASRDDDEDDQDEADVVVSGKFEEGRGGRPSKDDKSLNRTRKDEEGRIV